MTQTFKYHKFLLSQLKCYGVSILSKRMEYTNFSIHIVFLYITIYKHSIV